ncbi:hypothetical protein HK102_008442, partial [Quaeritorhiza haematococci]
MKDLTDALRVRDDHLDQLVEFYANGPFRALALKSYRAQQRGLEEEVAMLCGGSKKYGVDELDEESRRKWLDEEDDELWDVDDTEEAKL